ncbi:MAG: hypothetical protein JSV91_05545 [Phycisphaerales bacterium]|nr:MAG: hypothetical protein JSV91_05545 [Phycisphaerales bacterium]
MKPLLAFSMAFALSGVLGLSSASASDCPGDANWDGRVDIDDVFTVLAGWGSCDGCPEDIDNNGFVDIDDVFLVLADWGCEVNQGPKTSLSGFVTNLWTGMPIEGASVWVGEVELITNDTGFYTGDFDPGQYDLLFEAEYFNSYEDSIILFPGVPAEMDVALEPTAAVIVNTDIIGDAVPGGTVEVTAEVIILDGSTIEGFLWSQWYGTPAEILNADTDTATLNLGGTGDYKAELFHVLAEPPIGGESHAGLQNRFEVVGIYPFAVEEAGLLMLEVQVTTTSGVYHGDLDVETHLPWSTTVGVRNVPTNVPVLLHGKDQASYDWALTPPDGSSAVLDDAAGQNPEFTPDTWGLYQLTVTDIDAATTVEIDVYAGEWLGIIVGQDADGLPIADPSCVSCHEIFDADKFTPWSQTGHAHIFSVNLDTSTHYGPNCFSCHTVGFNTSAENGGFDDTCGYDEFLEAGLLNNPGDNWTTMLDLFPELARKANIQCENCHGPQDEAHTLPGGARVSLASEGCAICHGEPLRHARFQQWQLSGHGNYELAIDESQSGTCSKCHTVNGFLAWMPALLGEGDVGDPVEVTWTEDEAHPQTCVTCHDPHAIGTSTGKPNDAAMRISGHTPPLLSGFTAYGVGRGAICMTCHNSRRGLRNDSNFDDIYGTSEAARAPHGPTQTDLLMGENAYLVPVGFRANHSFLTDTCTNCHMEVTDPPEDLSYNLGGTNHEFSASTDICSECHGGGFEGEAIQAGVEDTLEILLVAIEDALIAYIGEQTGLGNIIDLNGEAQIMDVADVLAVEFTESHGRQAMAVTFTDNTTYGPYRMSDIDILDANYQLLGQFYDFADPVLIKSGWNYLLVHSDGSFGIHSATFTYQILTASISALNGGAAPMGVPAWLDDWKIPDWKWENRRR